MNLQEIKKSVEAINKLFLPIEEGEVSAIVAYKELKYMSGIITNALKVIERQTIEMVEESKLEHPEFTLSTRKSYDFKSSDYYNGKLKEYKIEEGKKAMKDIEKLLKTATDMDKVLYDAEGEEVRKVEVTFKEILTYRSEKK